jgi:hypothetical protein
MEDNNLPEMKRVIGLPQKREAIIAVLSECFSRDLVGLEEYEHRVELAHAAVSLDQLERLIGDVPAEVLDSIKRGALPARPGEGRELTVSHGVRKLDDQRLAVRQLDLKLTGSVVKLRYERIRDLPADMVIRADLTGSVLKICIPPEYAVEEDMDNSMSVIKYRRSRRWDGVPVTGRLRITGSASHSVVKIKTRRRRFR